MMADLFGTLAAILTTASFVPQTVLVLRTRNTEGLSLVMYAMFTLGITLWLVYGLMIGSLPIIIANVITLALASLILSMKVHNTILARRATDEPLL